MIEKEIYIYSDESRHRAERFMLLSGLWIEKKSLQEVGGEIKKIRERAGYDKNGEHIPFMGEFKWKKVSKAHLGVYKEVVDVLFDFLDKHLIRYCVMLIDTHDTIVREYDNIKTDGFYRLMYQLYLHNCRVPGKYWIYPDQITNPTHDVNLRKLKDSLECSLQNKFADKMNPYELGFKIIQEIKPIDSKKVDLLQMIDVVMGALGFYQNRLFERESASLAKTELMKYVMDKIIYSGALKFDGKNYLVVRSTRFNIWLFRPKNKNNP